MPAKKSKTKAAASWRTLTRKAAALEKANRGKPTAASKRLRTQASNLRKAERAGKKFDPIIAAMKEDGDWTVRIESAPAVNTEQPPRTYTQYELDAAVTKAAHRATVDIENSMVVSAMAAFEIENVWRPSTEPWVFTKAEVVALFNTLRRAGYTSNYAPQPRKDEETTEEVA